MKEYNLTFSEAIEKLFNKEGYIQGEEFKDGYYASVINDVVMLCSADSFAKENIILSKGLITQKFRLLICPANARR